MRRRAIVLVLGLLLVGGASLAYFGKFNLPNIPFPSDDGAPNAATAANAPSPPSADGSLKFDIARIDPKGASVFAGRAPPNTVVTILADGQPVGEAKADEFGEWAATSEYKFASADPKLTLEARPTGASDKVAEAPKVAAKSTPPKGAPSSAGAVTAQLMDNLKEMVETARREAAEAKAPTSATPSPPKTAPDARSGTQPPAAPEVKGGTQAPVAARDARPKSASEPSSSRTATVETRPSVSTAPPRVEPPLRVEPAKPPTALAARSQPAPVNASIPIPITFIYRESNFTDDGQRAAALLLEYLKLKKFSEVALSGHADEIGGPEYNMVLSKERLETVERFLRDGGFSGKLDLIPKGESEPFTGVDRTRLSYDEARQLDRRVELRTTH